MISATTDIGLIRMLMAGPAVSLTGIADDRGLVGPVGLAALAAVPAALDELLGVVPGAPPVSHEDGEENAGNQRTGEETRVGMGGWLGGVSPEPSFRAPTTLLEQAREHY